MVAKHLGNRENQVRGGRPLGQLAGELEAHHLRRKHVDRLAEHGSLGLDPAHTPSKYAEAIDHRRMRIGPDYTVRQRDGGAINLTQGHDTGQILQVHLVNNAGRGRNHPEIIEGVRSPAQEFVALSIALEFTLGVDQEGCQGSVFIYLHRVIDNQVDRNQRIDLLRITTEPGRGASQGGQVDDCRHSGEILHDDAGGLEGNLPAAGVAPAPGRQAQHILLAHLKAIALTQGGLQEDLD